ncbi:hypothetical protein CALCODRAFT_500270 [Calocera cornea HHB12733]|uniref:F-box domain-containing protein n=1 Tax=Calocera cornea HHB12733 TaxID=1353952 RepID=A0A165E5I0_9BASI|nr:hypothetical protein CALCODRAFT_500270 [Calocera cornea HHB12733]
MDKLPPELIRDIFREATVVPGCLEIRLGSNAEDEDQLTSRVERSYWTKHSLSLVSKLFHELADEYLYEYIHIRRHKHIRALVRALRSLSFDRQPRGRWCRRLVLAFALWDVPWNWGGITLWGLLPSCPRLLDLHCYLNHDYAPYRNEFEQWRFPVSPALAQILVALHGSRIRSLRLGWHMAITPELLERMLSHMPALRVFAIGYLQTRSPFPPPAQPLPEVSEEEMAYTEADEAEFDPVEELKEYREAAKTAEWPTESSAVFLPRLKRLDCSNFTPDIAHWHLPQLQEVTAGFDSRYLDRSDLVRLVLDIALQPHAATITHFTHASRPRIDIWSFVAEILPNIVHFGCVIRAIWAQADLLAPLPKLQTITIIRAPNYTVDVLNFLFGVKRFVEAGLLPSLQIIRFAGDREGTPSLVQSKEIFRKLGIRLVLMEGEAEGPYQEWWDRERYRGGQGRSLGVRRER